MPVYTNMQPIDRLSEIQATDTSGMVGTAGAEVETQILIDAIADKVATKLLAKSQVINNLLATAAGNPLDATQGKALKEMIDVTNSNFEAFNHNFTIITPDTVRVEFGTAGADGKTFISFIDSNNDQVAIEYWPDKIQLVKYDLQTNEWSIIWSLPAK